MSDLTVKNVLEQLNKVAPSWTNLFDISGRAQLEDTPVSITPELFATLAVNLVNKIHTGELDDENWRLGAAMYYTLYYAYKGKLSNDFFRLGVKVTLKDTKGTYIVYPKKYRGATYGITWAKDLEKELNSKCLDLYPFYSCFNCDKNNSHVLIGIKEFTESKSIREAIRQYAINYGKGFFVGTITKNFQVPDIIDLFKKQIINILGKTVEIALYIIDETSSFKSDGNIPWSYTIVNLDDISSLEKDLSKAFESEQVPYSGYCKVFAENNKWDNILDNISIFED